MSDFEQGVIFFFQVNLKLKLKSLHYSQEDMRSVPGPTNDLDENACSVPRV